MGNLSANRFARGPARLACRRGRIPDRRTRPLAGVVLFAAFAFLCAGCKHIQPLDTKSLDAAGITFDTIQQLKALKITPPEITEIIAAHQGGLSDAGCVQVLQIFRGRGKAFDAGDAVGGLRQVGISEPAVLELVTIDQVGLGAGDLQAMHLAGLSDEIVLTVAHRHADGKPVLSGASLAGLKNTGLRESTILELARRGVPDSQAAEIIALRRKRVNDAEILRRFPGS
jgi:hypothetical protein